MFKRQNSPYFYAQIKNPETGTFLPARSTGKDEESEALLVVADWIKNGIPEAYSETRRDTRHAIAVDTIVHRIREAELTAGDAERIVSVLTERGLIGGVTPAADTPESEPLQQFLERFWDYDCSPYVREKLAYGHSIGRRHCYEQTKRPHHWKAFFGDARLADLTRERLREFQLYLKEKKLAAKTCNVILSAGTVALVWATDNGILKTNPAENLRKFSGNAAERGIITIDEAQRLFAMHWADERARVGSLVAMTCGLRSGEVVALRRDDVGEDRLYVHHSWSFADGLKSPKNGETREVPLLPAVRKALLSLSDKNPHGSDGFIFYHNETDRPCDREILRKGLMRALVDMSLPAKDRKNKEKREESRKRWLERGISFHSWRHFYATNMADRVDIRSVQLATGHRSADMANHYAKHAQEKHFEGVSSAMTEAFATVIQFPTDQAFAG